MRDRHFMEDENELPYLVWETRDDDSGSESGKNDYRPEMGQPKSGEERLDALLKSLPISVFQRVRLKEKLISLLGAKDVTEFTVVEEGFGSCTFVFTRENEYVRAINEFEFYSDLGDLKRIFAECYSRHNYDNLIRSQRFQEMVKRSGMEFVRCSGGYETDYSMADDEFSFSDEINVRTIFKDGSSERPYRLDLDKMELSKHYYEI